MSWYKIAESQEELNALNLVYNLALQTPEEQRKPYQKLLIEHMQTQPQAQPEPEPNNPYGFQEGQKLTFTKKSGYKGWCTLEKINEDGSFSVIDHSGRRMSKFQPVQMGMNMFEEMG